MILKPLAKRDRYNESVTTHQDIDTENLKEIENDGFEFIDSEEIAQAHGASDNILSNFLKSNSKKSLKKKKGDKNQVSTPIKNPNAHEPKDSDSDTSIKKVTS